jgi:hypothetical protein
VSARPEVRSWTARHPVATVSASGFPVQAG